MYLHLHHGRFLASSCNDFVPNARFRELSRWDMFGRPVRGGSAVSGQNPRLTTRFLIDSSAMKIFFPSIALPVVALLLYFLLPGVKERPWTALRISGVIFALLGYLLATVARVQLGDSFTVRPQARELVTQGFYARIRNPMYVFLDLMVFGLILVFQAYWLLVALAVLVVIQAMQSRREAKVLEEKFGQRYLEYRNETWF